MEILVLGAAYPSRLQQTCGYGGIYVQAARAGAHTHEDDAACHMAQRAAPAAAGAVAGQKGVGAHGHSNM